MDDAKQILDALRGLDEKFDGLKTDIADLKKTDKDLATEVHRIGEEQRKQGRELQELRAETLRTFESERHASAQTVQAITKHVDEAAKAFHAKAEDIDALKAETFKQTDKLGLDASGVLGFIRKAEVKDIVKILTLIAAIIAAWKGIK